MRAKSDKYRYALIYDINRAPIAGNIDGEIASQIAF